MESIRKEEHHDARRFSCVRSLLGDRGQGIVEFALILPVFMLLFLGLVDFGAAYNVHNDLTQLAGEAVRFAAVDNCGTRPCTGGTIASQVRSDADNSCLRGPSSVCGGFTGPNQPLAVCFFFPLGTSHAGDPVEAVVQTSYLWLPFNIAGFAHVGSVKLRATATMRIEQPPNPGAGGTLPYSDDAELQGNSNADCTDSGP